MQWEQLIVSSELKGKQQSMQDVLTELWDVVNKLQDEAAILAEKWSGTASETFFCSLKEAWTELKKEVKRMSEAVNALEPIEEDARACEKKAGELLGLKGVGSGWENWENFW